MKQRNPRKRPRISDKEEERISSLQKKLGKRVDEDDGLDALLTGITSAESQLKDDFQQNQHSGSEESAEDETDGNDEKTENVLQQLKKEQREATCNGANRTKSTNEPKPDKINIYGKYVPPAQRQIPAVSKHVSEVSLRLQRQIQGCLNRLSEANITVIASEIQLLFQSYPRGNVTTSLTQLILASVESKSHLLESFVNVYAALVTAIYRTMGTQFAAYFVQTLVETYERLLHSGDTSKQASNFIVLLTELYAFETVSCILIYDIIRVLLNEISELNVELLLKILRNCGPMLRADDPSALKDIVSALQLNISRLPAQELGSRTKFLIETVTDLKNNKVKNKLSSSRATESRTRLRKALGALSGRKFDEPLRVSLGDIHSVETKGKWWLVGSSWKETGPDALRRNHSASQETAGDNAALVRLAREQGMNTDVRKSIFATIMNANDYVDALASLGKLGLKRAQEQEIPRVLIHCCGSEKSYNPYYAYIAKRLCAKHSHSVAIQFCIWELFKQMEEESDSVPLRRVLNLAMLTADLITAEALDFSLFKVLRLPTLAARAEIFMEVLFVGVFRNLDSTGDLTQMRLQQMFSKAGQNESLRKGLQWLLKKRIRQSDMIGSDKEILYTGVSLTASALQHMNAQ